MENLKQAPRHRIPAAAAAVAAVLVIAAAIYWFLPKFHNVTVELGTQSIGLEDFMTGFATPGHVSFASDVGSIDLGKPGTTQLTLKNLWQTQQVTLTVKDTAPPEVTFVSRLTKNSDYTPEASDFVENINDLSETRVYFREPVTIPEDYSDLTVTVVVEDAGGNRTMQNCTLSLRWMPETYQLELGAPLTAASLLYCPEKDADLIDPKDIAAINAAGVGKYILESECGSKSMTCTVTVTDTTGPLLQVKNISAMPWQKITAESFVVSTMDFSGDVKLELLTEIDTKTYGQQEVTLRATDIHGNTTEKTAIVAITQNQNPPRILGATEALVLEKHAKVDFLEGVSASDTDDGAVEVVCDSSAVNLDAPGTYYLVYSATDSDFNITTVKRKVVVNHDAEDTKALVDKIADTLGSDPEELRDYVRDGIAYNHDWGGDDPVWYGFTTKTGNCYVHALCLQELLTRKGHNCQLIWTTNKTHYWLIIELEDGVWRHIDPTPSKPHNKISLMNDEERYSLLGTRNWDRSAWPACK